MVDLFGRYAGLAVDGGKTADMMEGIGDLFLFEPTLFRIVHVLPFTTAAGAKIVADGLDAGGSWRENLG